MIVVKIRDTRERTCKCCNRKIIKGSVIVKYEEIQNEWKHTKMWFGHIDCAIKKLNLAKETIKKKEEELRNLKIYIGTKNEWNE